MCHYYKLIIVFPFIFIPESHLSFSICFVKINNFIFAGQFLETSIFKPPRRNCYRLNLTGKGGTNTVNFFFLSNKFQVVIIQHSSDFSFPLWIIAGNAQSARDGEGGLWLSEA